MFVFVFLCITLCSFEFRNHLEEEVEASCFSIIVIQCIVTINVLWLFLFDWYAVCNCNFS